MCVHLLGKGEDRGPGAFLGVHQLLHHLCGGGALPEHLLLLQSLSSLEPHRPGKSVNTQQSVLTLTPLQVKNNDDLIPVFPAEGGGGGIYIRL